MTLKEFLALKPKQKRKIFYKKSRKIKKVMRKRFIPTNTFNFKSKNKKHMLKHSEILLIGFVVIIGVLITIGLGIKFDEIPIIIHTGIYSNESFWESFLINVHNMFLDYLVFGVVMVYLLKRIEDRRRANDYYDLIEDYRGWQHQTEVAIRISSYVRRLNKMGYYEFNLAQCSLNSSRLEKLKFDNSKFEGTTLRAVDFTGSKFKHCNFKGNNAQDIKIVSVAFLDSNLINFRAINGKISDTILENCELRGADFTEAKLESVTFKNCKMDDVIYKNAVLENVNLKTAKNINIENLIMCKSISKSCKFEESILNEIKMLKPNILI